MIESRLDLVREMLSDGKILRPRDLEARGIPRMYLQRLLTRGEVERIGRGLYRLADGGENLTEYHSLAEVAAQVRGGVVCLLSALRFHELTTQDPFEVWVAIANKAWSPRSRSPPLRILRMSEDSLRAGVEHHELEGVDVKIFSPAKTVADCFKFRHQIGLDVALEALDDYRQRYGTGLDELWSAAEICRVTRVIRPYLEGQGMRPKKNKTRPQAGPGVAASVRTRLLRVSKDREEDFDRTLKRYAVERLLYRLSLSSDRERFALKGAVLFTLWSPEPHRPTRDLDFDGHGSLDPMALAKTFAAISRLAVPVDDGLEFDPTEIHPETIRPNEEYQGVRLRLTAFLGQARIRLQIDIGTGSPTLASLAVQQRFPTILDSNPEPWVLAYPPEMVITEKFHAMVALGLINSRMKDYYDIYHLSEDLELEGAKLHQALFSIFQHRRTLIPSQPPPALSERIWKDTEKNRQWKAFLRRNDLKPIALERVTTRIVELIWPPLLAAVSEDEGSFQLTWQPGGPWR